VSGTCVFLVIARRAYVPIDVRTGCISSDSDQQVMSSILLRFEVAVDQEQDLDTDQTAKWLEFASCSWKLSYEIIDTTKRRKADADGV